MLNVYVKGHCPDAHMHITPTDCSTGITTVVSEDIL